METVVRMQNLLTFQEAQYQLGIQETLHPPAYKVCVCDSQHPIMSTCPQEKPYVIYDKPNFMAYYNASSGYTAGRFRGDKGVKSIYCDRSTVKVKPVGSSRTPYRITYERDWGSSAFLHVIYTDYIFCNSEEDAVFIRNLLSHPFWMCIITTIIDVLR